MAAAFAASALGTSLVSAALDNGAQSFLGNSLGNRVAGGPGDDSMSGLAGDDFLRGAGGGDTLSGDDDNDTLIGDDDASQAGNDQIDGGAGDDQITGGSGDDQLSGGPGRDTIGSIDLASIDGPAFVEAGADTLNGGADEDILDGGPDSDFVVGGSGNDLVQGGAGNDLLLPGPGDDQALGGSGTDKISFAGSAGPVTVDLAAGTASGEGSDLIDSVERAQGGGSGDTIKGDGAANLLEGGDGPDILDGRGGMDALAGGPGADTLRNSQSTGTGDTIDGGDDDDRVEALNGVVDTIDCGPGSDVAIVDQADTVANCEHVRYTTPVPYTLSVSAQGDGAGTVSGDGISCPGDCTETYDDGTVVALSAKGTGGSSFTGWSGACSGKGACSVTMDGNRSVGARFAAPDTRAPQTKITSGPKRVKAKRKATVRFGFRSSEKRSSFKCKLDGKTLRGKCKSLKKLKLGIGKHTFSVAARDRAGNVDRSPAKRTVKIIKKKGRH